MPRTRPTAAPEPDGSGRRRLDREQVMVTAEAIVDREGWQHLTMTLLAGELGVKVPSLYNHVPNLEALRAALQIRTLRALGIELRDVAMGKTQDRAFRALAAVFRDFATRHPGRYDLAMREPIDRPGFAEAAADAAAAMTAVVGSYGMDSPDVLGLQLSAFAAMHGVVVLENSGFFDGIADVDPIYETVLELVLRLLDDHRPDKAKTA